MCWFVKYLRYYYKYAAVFEYEISLRLHIRRYTYIFGWNFIDFYPSRVACAKIFGDTFGERHSQHTQLYTHRIIMLKCVSLSSPPRSAESTRSGNVYWNDNWLCHCACNCTPTNVCVCVQAISTHTHTARRLCVSLWVWERNALCSTIAVYPYPVAAAYPIVSVCLSRARYRLFSNAENSCMGDVRVSVRVCVCACRSFPLYAMRCSSMPICMRACGKLNFDSLLRHRSQAIEWNIHIYI